MNVGALGFGRFAEFFAGHGRAMDAIATGFCANVNYWVALAGSFRVEDLIFADQTESKGIHQRIAGVAGLELGFAAEIGNSETVAV